MIRDMRRTYVSDNELEIRSNDTQAQCWKRKRPVRIAFALHGSKGKGNHIGPGTETHDTLVGDFVLDQRGDSVCEQAHYDHWQHVHAGHEGVVSKLSLEVECYPEREHWEAKEAKRQDE